MSVDRETPLTYIKTQLFGSASEFMKEWRTLSESERNTLKEWANEEQDFIASQKVSA